jgi:putative ABC transport system substrate-binding protein
MLWFFANGKTITTLALDVQLPRACTDANIARAGALVSHGPSFPALFRRAVEIFDKILRGTKPEISRFEQPTKFDLVINLKTATYSASLFRITCSCSPTR